MKPRHRLPRAAAFALGALAAGAAHAAEFSAIHADRSRIGFVYKQMGVAVEGRFPRFAARLAFDPARPQAAQASLDIDLATVDAGSPEASAEVLGKPWFDAKTFPVAKFVATAFKPAGAGRYDVTGRLSIKGRSVEVSAPAVFKQDGATGAFDGSFTIRRADFGIGVGVWSDFGTVANEVRIDFHLVAGTAANKP